MLENTEQKGAKKTNVKAVIETLQGDAERDILSTDRTKCVIIPHFFCVLLKGHSIYFTHEVSSLVTRSPTHPVQTVI